MTFSKKFLDKYSYNLVLGVLKDVSKLDHEEIDTFLSKLLSFIGYSALHFLNVVLKK